MLNFAEELMNRFKGLDKAYGIYNLTTTTEVEREGTKIVGKPSTIKGQVDLELWEKHVAGEQGLGIVPIMDDSNCFFGAIDVDIYHGLDLQAIALEIEKNDLPLIPCRTKSGGVHCYCFTKERVPASLMRQKLQLFSSVLGFGESEIFPKQTQILSDRGDIGQWINVPYFCGENTNRYAIRTDGKPMGLQEFIETIDKKSKSYKEFLAFTVILVEALEDGPPCLQFLVSNRFKSGSRNDGFMNVAIYLKKKKPDTWQNELDEYNLKYVDPPLSSTEIQGISKSLDKKEYNYFCNRSPLKKHCDSALCKLRQFGIGISVSIKLTGLTKYDSQPPIWFVDVEGGGRLELSTEALQSQSKFQKQCMDGLNIMPPVIATKLWVDQISELMENVNLIKASVDSSPKGLLFEYLERFCTSRVQARNKEELLLGKPWSDERYHWFRMSDFYAFLEKLKFKDFKINQICSVLKENGGETDFIKIKGKGINIWKYPCFEKQTEPFSEPLINDKEVM